MTDLAAWLIDRIAEDEEVARAATPGPWYVESQMVNPPKPVAVLTRRTNISDDAVLAHHVANPDDLRHIARHDPARVLAECAAKRRVVERYTVAATRLERQQGDRAIEGIRANESYAVLKLLALPYSDRDGYDPAWAVE